MHDVRVVHKVLDLLSSLAYLLSMPATQPTRTFVAIDPATALHLRAATDAEIAAFAAANPRTAFERPTRVGAVLIDSYMGPGGSHIPGRFLP